MATPVRFQAAVARILRHSDDDVTYEFRYLGNRPRYRPGQFLHLALDPYDPSKHWPESRAFTIANGTTDREIIRLTIAAKGTFTRRIIGELQVGDEVWMKAPYGTFIVKTATETEAVLIAGGTGVTPFVALMEDALVEGLEGSVTLHYGARVPELLVFKKLADRCVSELPLFRACYYTEFGSADGVTAGRVDLDTICSGVADIARSVFYLCGPAEMVMAFSGRLQGDFGVLPECIRIDEWG